MTHASESGHWYDRNGNPVWEVTGAKGQSVKPDIRHARKLGLLPGTTSIAKCAAQEGLVRWKIEQSILAAYTLPAVPGESYDAWMARVFTDSETQGRQAADRGTLLHAAVQAHFQGESPDPEFWPYVKAVVAVVEKHCGKQEWRAERSFAHELGYGGKVDLSSGEWVLDFKSKEAADLDNPQKKLIYDEHPQQLGPYRRGLGIPKARCANVFFSRTEPIIVKFCEHDQTELDRGTLMFDYLLSYWQVKNRYDSSFTREKLAA